MLGDAFARLLSKYKNCRKNMQTRSLALILRRIRWKKHCGQVQKAFPDAFAGKNQGLKLSPKNRSFLPAKKSVAIFVPEAPSCRYAKECKTKINKSNLSPTNSAGNLPATPRANSPALFGPGVANISKCQ